MGEHEFLTRLYLYVGILTVFGVSALMLKAAIGTFRQLRGKGFARLLATVAAILSMAICVVSVEYWLFWMGWLP